MSVKQTAIAKRIKINHAVWLHPTVHGSFTSIMQSNRYKSSENEIIHHLYVDVP